MQRLLGCLPRLDLAAGELPPAGEAGGGGATRREQQTRVVEVVDDGGGHDEHRSHGTSVPVARHSGVTRARHEIHRGGMAWRRRHGTGPRAAARHGDTALGSQACHVGMPALVTAP